MDHHNTPKKDKEKTEQLKISKPNLSQPKIDTKQLGKTPVATSSLMAGQSQGHAHKQEYRRKTIEHTNSTSTTQHTMNNSLTMGMMEGNQFSALNSI